MTGFDHNTVELKDKGLKKLIKAFSEGIPSGRIGILGAAGKREGEGPSNAEIGAAHEYGTTTNPVRSFLREPINDHLDGKLKSSGAFSADTIKEVIATGNIRPYVEKICIVALAVVKEGFATNGYGKWKPSNMLHKTNKQTLVETTQLRDSITWDVP